jgi:hypothetical protein
MKCWENKIKKIIKEELDNLFESFEFVNNDETFIPTVPISKASSLAISVYENLNKKGNNTKSLDENGNEGSGRNKASELSERKPQNFAQVKRLKAFFDKNQKEIDNARSKFGITPEKNGSEEEMLKGGVLLIWNLHGGNACRDWVNNLLTNKHKSNLKTKERLRKAGGAGNNKGMGTFRTKYDPTNMRIHR